MLVPQCITITAHYTGKNDEVDSLHVPAMKFIGYLKQLVYLFQIILLK